MSDVTVRPAVDDDMPAITRLWAEAFSLRADFQLVGSASTPNGRWVAERNGKVEATMWANPVGQRFGGATLEGRAISAVAVAPHTRGKGVGGEMLRTVMAELHAQGALTSALYPSTVGPYRRVGYGLAGEHRQMSIVVSEFAGAARWDAEGELQAFEPEDLPAVVACYERSVAGWDGPLLRPEWWWRMQAFGEAPAAEVPHGVVVRHGGVATGYLFYRKAAATGAPTPYHYEMRIHGLMAETPGAWAALAGFVASHGVLGHKVQWTAMPGGDPWSLLLPGPPARCVDAMPWMLRLVDVRGALAARRYPQADGVEVTLTIRDPVIAANEGTWLVRVQDETATVDEIASGAVEGPSLDVADLASLYCGWVTPDALARAGRLDNLDEASATALTRLFGGTRAWMQERF